MPVSTAEYNEGVENEFLEDSRTGASPALPPRYKPISIKFKSDEDAEHNWQTEEGFTRWVTARVEQGVDSRRSSGFDDRVRLWRNQYEQVTRRKDKPWPGCSNLFIPLTPTIVDALHAHVTRTLFGVSPLFQGTWSDPALTEDAEAKQSAMEHIARDVLHLPEIGDSLIKSGLVDGTSIAVNTYQVRVKKTRSLEEVTPDLRASLLDEADATLRRQLEGVPDSTPLNPVWRTIFREEVYFDGGEVLPVDVLDFGMYPVDAPGLEDALLMWCRRWHTADQLWEKVKSGEFDEEAVRELTRKPSQGPNRHAYRAGGDQYRYESEGIQTGNVVSEEDRPYETFLTLARRDLDDDGLAELILCEVETATNTLLRCELYPYYHDRPFFVPIVPYRREGFFYGYSLCQIIGHIQAEANALHNQYVDNNTLRGTPTFFFNRESQWNPERHPFAPGMAIAVRGDIEKNIRLMEFSALDPESYGIVKEVSEMAKELAATGETILGGTPASGTTAQAVERAVQGSNVKFDIIVDRVRSSFDEIVNQQASLYAQYAKEDFSYPLGFQGKKLAFANISRKQMQTKMGFTLRGTSALSNPAVKAQRAEKLQMLAERIPAIQMDPRLAYEVAEEVIEGLGYEDPQRFLGDIESFTEKMEAANAPAPPEKKVSVTERRDEVLTLNIALTEGVTTPEDYLATAILAKQAQDIMQPPVAGTRVEDSTDDAAGPPPAE